MNSLQKEYLLNLSYIYIQYGRFEDALTFLLLLKQLFSKDPVIMFLRAFAYLQLHNYAAAKEELDYGLPWATTAELRLSAYRMRSQAFFGLNLKDEYKFELDRYLKLLSEHHTR